MAKFNYIITAKDETEAKDQARTWAAKARTMPLIKQSKVRTLTHSNVKITGAAQDLKTGLWTITGTRTQVITEADK